MINEQMVNLILTICQSKMINYSLGVVSVKNYKENFNKELIKRFENTHGFVMRTLINLFCY